VAFLGTFFLFLPATAAMGATLPAMERLAARARGEGDEQQSIAAIYAANTFGAVGGVLAAAFWLIPAIGLGRTAGISVALNLACGLTALIAFRDRTSGAGPVSASATTAHAAPVLARLALTGFLGIGFEVLVVRVLSQVTEDTVYTFALLLAVYLIGSAAGAAGYQRGWARRRAVPALTDRLLVALGGACLLGAASLWTAEAVKTLALRALGGGIFAAMAAEAALAIAAFGPATVAMGALFSHLSDDARARGAGFGRALGVNTLGAAAAPAVWGVVAIPSLGPKLALILVVAGYLALTSRPAWRKPIVWAPAGIALALALLAPPLRFIDVPAGGRVASYREGVMGAVTVVEDASGVATLRINNRQQEGSSATFRFDARQAWLPLLLHPAPARALFLGLGTGVTARAAAEAPGLLVDAVELLPEVIQASAAFSREPVSPRFNAIAADARRYVRASAERYDVIVSDNFHPARSGSGALYTVEHFRAVRQRLNAGGVFCQWLPLHQLDLETVRTIARSFLIAFPRGWAMLANNSLETPVLGLVGRADASRFDVAAIHDRFARTPLPDPVAGIGLEDEFAVLGSFVAGPEALRRFAGDADANTDDRPVVAYRAPRITYAPDSRPRDRLFALLNEVTIEPGELILPATEPMLSTWPPRLAAYWVARDRFIESGREVQPSPRLREMLAQVREPLLAVLRISPDFRPAYDPLLAMATALARSDLAGARQLLTELSRIQPARDEASRAISSLASEAALAPP
jgi:spermidine synthase